MTAATSLPSTASFPRAPTRIKICGLTRAADVDAAVCAGADAVGFVLYPHSPRAVTVAQAAALARRLPPLVTPVLLFVRAPRAAVVAACTAIPRCIIQFHDDSSAADCAATAAAAGRAWWRVARIPAAAATAGFDLLEFAADSAAADALLLDAQAPGWGGGGKPFDWAGLPAHVPAHLILSGGLSAANVGAGIRALRGRGRSLAVDVSSGVEAVDAAGHPRKGIKDAARIQAFIAAVRAADAAY